MSSEFFVVGSRKVGTWAVGQVRSVMGWAQLTRTGENGPHHRLFFLPCCGRGVPSLPFPSIDGSLVPLTKRRIGDRSIGRSIDRGGIGVPGMYGSAFPVLTVPFLFLVWLVWCGPAVVSRVLYFPCLPPCSPPLAADFAPPGGLVKLFLHSYIL